MKVLVIGGTGHIGRFLTPMLVRDGHETVVLTRGTIPPAEDAEWERVHRLQVAYTRGGSDWSEIVTAQHAEVVIDILGVDVNALYRAAKPTCRHILCCGSVWMLGTPRVIPTPETPQTPCLFDGYRRRFDELRELQQTAVRDGVAFTAILPPNICGPGKVPLDTRGGRDLDVHHALARGTEVVLPFPGNNLIGPCDAEDIARAFCLAVQNRERARGEFFNVGSAYALTAEQFVATYARIYGTKLRVRWVDYREFTTDILPAPGAHFHFTANMCPSIAKLREKLAYVPRYTPEQTLARAVDWMRAEGLV